jgi:CRP-like cAMP-binding protein
MSSIKIFIENYTNVPVHDWQQIEPCFEKKIFKKNEHILLEGKVCKYLYFLEKGLLRFYINKDGNHITKYFTEAPYFFTAQTSFNAQIPATENIQAIENCVIHQISYQQTNHLYKLESWSTFGRKITQQVQHYTEEILEQLQTETAEARYKQMQISDANLLQRIPLQYLASYLGIAPQSLSRIRKKEKNNLL